MIERVSTLLLGDWSGDGHGDTESIRVRMTGEDLSDERLRRAKAEAIEASGVDIERLFEDYDDCMMPEDAATRIMDAGIHLTPADDSQGSFSMPYSIKFEDSEESEEYDVVALLMAYLGYGIQGFKYEVLKDDIIVGGRGTVMGSFGYGLYS